MPTTSISMAEITLAEHATWSYIEVFAYRIDYGPMQLRHTGERFQPLGIKKHDLAPMPKNDLKIWESIKDTSKDKSKKLNSTIVVPSETERGKCKIDLRVEAGVVG